MNYKSYTSEQTSLRFWIFPLFFGILFLILTIVNFALPNIPIKIASYIFSFSFLLAGLTEIYAAFKNRHNQHFFSIFLSFGILTTLFSVYMFFNTEKSFQALVFVLGIIILTRSIMGIIFAFDVKNYGVKNWYLPMFYSLIGVIFSLLLLFKMQFARNILVWISGITLFSVSIFNFYVAFKFRTIGKKAKLISDKFQDKIKGLEEEIQNEWNNW